MTVHLKRIYDPVSPQDGKRILIDRLWPRGISKEQATWHEWLKEAAPSPELRKWFAHQEELFDLFRKQYEQELAIDPKKREAMEQLLHEASNGDLTLLYAAKSERINHAIILRDWLINLQG